MSIRDILAARKTEKETGHAVLHAHDQFLLSKKERPSYRKTGVLHPSEISGDVFCPRAFALRELFPELKKLDIDARQQTLFDLGTAAHTMLQQDFAEMGRLYGWYRCLRCGYRYLGFLKRTCRRCEGHYVYEELTVRNAQYRIHGHTDGIWVSEDLRSKYVLELKTINDQGFSGVSGAGEPLKSHQRQSLIYLDGLETEKRKRMDALQEGLLAGRISQEEYKRCLTVESLPFSGTIVYYYNKNDSMRTEFIITNNASARRFMDTRYKELAPAIKWLDERGRLPKCVKPKDKWCKTCAKKKDFVG